MIYGATLSTYRRREGSATWMLLGFGAITTVLLALLVGLLPNRGLPAAAILLSAVVMLPLIWRWPQMSAYFLLFAAVVFEEQPFTFGLSITDKVPAFQDLQSLVGVRGLAMNPIEVLGALAVCICLLKSRATGAKFETGPLTRPFLLLGALLLVALVRGHIAGGDLTIALWGIRGMILMALVYVTTLNVIRTRSQVRTLAAIFIFGAAFKGLVGLWRFGIDLHGNISKVTDRANGLSLMAHEESFFFSLVLLLTLLAFVYGLRKRDRRPILISAALVLLPFLANERRTAVAAIALGLLLLLAVLYALQPSLRRRICQGLLVAALLLPPYFAYGWSHASLLTAPVQAVKSGFDPNARDLSSNHYREVENANLRATAAQNRLLGVGLGLKMAQPKPLPDIGSTYTWYLYLPHNNLLWLGMTMGILGLFAFTYLIAAFALQALGGLIATSDPEMRLLCVFSLLALTAFLVSVMLDQGLLNQRIGVFIGVLMGLVGVAPRLGWFAAPQAVVERR